MKNTVGRFDQGGAGNGLLALYLLPIAVVVARLAFLLLLFLFLVLRQRRRWLLGRWWLLFLAIRLIVQGFDDGARHEQVFRLKEEILIIKVALGRSP